MVGERHFLEIARDQKLAREYSGTKRREIGVNKQVQLSRVIESIESFAPTNVWGNEDSYHKELLGWLKHPFPEIRYELQTGGSRPDLVIANIAIEVKGPTDNNSLNTLATKILKYSNYYEYVVIVLFETSFSERNFEEIMTGIKRTYSHVYVIRK